MKSPTVNHYVQRDWVHVLTDVIFYAVEALGAVAFIAMCVALWIVTPEWPLPTQWWEFLVR